MIRIEDWSIVSIFPSPYTAPELMRRHLQGTVYGHPVKRDGTVIITSPIEAVSKLAVTTYTGNIYSLGRPDPVYLEWLLENDIEFDPDEPVKIK